MNFAEFKTTVMQKPDFGKDPAEWPKLDAILPKIKQEHQAELIAAVLKAGNAGVILREGRFAFASLDAIKSDNGPAIAAIAPLIELLGEPGVSESDIKTIFTSESIHILSNAFDNESAEWLFTVYNFPKAYGMLFIQALNAQRPFTLWKGHVPIPSPGNVSSGIELKPILLNVLKLWPTGGRSGYALLCQLRELASVKALAADKEIATALDDVEGRCDFGSLEKLRLGK